MTPASLTVRCMAWQESEVWVAACLDLALAVQGQSPAEAKAKLHTQITAYVREAMTVDSAHADVLLTRKAPLTDRLRFWFWAAVANRPRLRRTVGISLRRIGIALRRKLAYVDPLPLTVRG